MPGSAISYGSGGTHSSLSSSKRKNRYRTVANNSQVDESLFGAPARVEQRNEMLAEKWKPDGEVTIERVAAARSAKRRSGGKHKKETVQIITKDLVRSLIVPSEDPSGQSIVMSRRDLERILRESRVMTKAEREAERERIKQEKEDAQDACTERKNFMNMMELTRKKNEPLNDLEEEAKERAQHLLEKANELIQEQDDEIKGLNEMILGAKCHAIRDAQVLEKRIIEKEMSEEEKRLDIMMEVERQNAIRIQEEIEAKRKSTRAVGALAIQEQIEENEQEHLLELERKDQENRAMQKKMEAIILEDRDKVEEEKSKKVQLREDLNEANAELMQRKVLSIQHERALEASVQEFNRKKAEREAEYEKEQERIRIEKEREVARLRALQERAKDAQEERDALRAKRAAEARERDWRKKEADEARHKLEVNEMLRDAREMQLAQKEHVLAVQAHRDRIEFEKILRTQQELASKERRQVDERSKKNKNYSKEIRDQIREKERERIDERAQFFEEGIKLDEEARARRHKLDEIKKKKLRQLKDCGIPDKYMAQIERKVNQGHHVSA